MSRRKNRENSTNNIIREDEGKTDGPKTKEKATATEAANKANQTKLNNGSKQRRYIVQQYSRT